MQILDGYFEQNVHHLNVNVFDTEKLIDAMEHPEKEEYQNFTIRVSGYAVKVISLTRKQQMDFVTELFEIAKRHGIHTALDTNGAPFRNITEYLEKFQKLMSVTDLFILDIKEMNGERHMVLTGQDNQNILELARYLSDHGKAMWIRHVLVPGITDSEEDLQALARFLNTLKTVEKREILPYHTLGIYKWENLGLEYSLKEILSPAP